MKDKQSHQVADTKRQKLGAVMCFNEITMAIRPLLATSTVYVLALFCLFWMRLQFGWLNRWQAET